MDLGHSISRLKGRSQMCTVRIRAHSHNLVDLVWNGPEGRIRELTDFFGKMYDRRLYVIERRENLSNREQLFTAVFPGVSSQKCSY